MALYLDGLIFLVIQHILGLIVPGPCTGLVIRNSLYDRSVGLKTVFGAVCGSFSIKTISVLGFALLLQQIPRLFFAFKLFGAGYLILLGLSSFFKAYQEYRSQEQNKSVLSDFPQRSPFVLGYLMSLTNPLSSIRFIVLFSTVITAEMTLPIQMSYLLVLAFVSLVFYGLVSLFFSTPTLQQALERYRYLLNAALGSTMIYWGIQVLKVSL